MPTKNNIVEAKISVDNSGKITKVERPLGKEGKPDLPLSGKQYGWSIADYAQSGIDLPALFAQSVDVAASPADNAEHLNTIQIRGPELIKLDVGHWGAYHRWREYPTGEKADAESREQGIQREFGLIENYRVWLCRFEGTKETPDTLTTFQDAAAPLCAKLVQSLPSDVGIEIVAFADVTDARGEELEPDRLYAIFPDLHLPEGLPDFPPLSVRNPNKSAREKLRALLNGAQHRPGLMYRNKVDEDEQTRVQAHLDSLPSLADIGTATQPVWTVQVGLPGFKKDVQFTPREFLAEKAIVDREIMLTSTWFYARGLAWNHNAEDRDEAATADDDGDPTPAIDLAILLCAVRKVMQGPGAKVSVIQVGDLFELWLNHEFLYRNFAADTSYRVVSPSAYTGIWAKGSTADDYQFRMDRNWPDDEGVRHPTKRYVFNGWPKADMLLRHLIGEPQHLGMTDEQLEEEISLSAEEKLRVQTLLRERVENVRTYTLHDPISARRIRLDGMLDTFKNYYRKANDSRKPSLFQDPGGSTVDADGYFLDARGRREIFYNQLILDLFEATGFRNIGGNHDGYRSDPLLNSQLSSADKAERVISEPGLWVEHSHRWDAYNRDGMAFGAGAANYVYYYFNSLCSRFAGSMEDLLGNQEQSCFTPGAALWFALINFGTTGTWMKRQNLPGDVKPFAVYVSGHTHSASLAKVHFKYAPKAPPAPSSSSSGSSANREIGPKW